MMFLKLAYFTSKLRFSSKYLFSEHQISAGQLSADSSLTETLFVWIEIAWSVIIIEMDLSQTSSNKALRKGVNQNVCICLPEHPWVLHAIDCWDGPRQCLPPLEGAGLSQALFRYCEPPPQVLVHWLYCPHGDQWPSTGKKSIIISHLRLLS